MMRGCRNVAITLLIIVLATFSLFAYVGHSMNRVSEPTATPFPYISTTQEVLLKAKPWNDGQVYVWDAVREGGVGHTTLPEGTACVRADPMRYTLGQGQAAVHYYKLDCAGVVGFVEREQVTP